MTSERNHQQPLAAVLGTLPLCWRVVIKPFRWQALVIFLVMISSAVLEMVTVGLSVPLFDAVTNPNQLSQNRISAMLTQLLRSFGVSPSPNWVLFALLAMVCSLFIGRATLSLFQQYYTAAVAHLMRRKMKIALFEGSLRAHYEEQLQKGRGTILQDINSPSNAIHNAFVNVEGLFTGIFQGVFLLGLMVYLSWWAALLIGLFAVGGLQGLRKFLDRRSYTCGRTIYELQRDLAKFEVDVIDGFKVVKAYTLEGKIIEREQALLAAEARPLMKIALFRNVPMFINEVVASLMVLGLGGVAFLWPSLGMRFSTLIAFLLAIRKVGPAIGNVNVASVELNRLRRDLEVIEEIIHWMQPERQGGRAISRVEELRLADLSFYYVSRPECQVLDRINVRMRRETVTAIVGPTGAGKTTIASLLVGLYAPRSGAVLVNNVDLNGLSLTAWRQKIGYVSQDTFLFNATLRENITLWDERISQADLERAAAMAQLHQFVVTLPERYETIVGDRGVRLSGGQCQRVAIARAILKRPEVLIFDEATSALDNLTESAVYQAIRSLRSDAVVVVIAHRLSTVRDADQIVVLQSGKVVEVGTHDALMNRGGAYAALYHRDGQEPEPSPAEPEVQKTLIA